MEARRRPAPERIVCVRCLEPREPGELDRILWCQGCRAATRSRAAVYGYLVGSAVAVALGLWIWFVVRPRYFPAAWAGIVAAAFWLSGRAAREIVYGILRFKNRPGAQASGPRPLP